MINKTTTILAEANNDNPLVLLGQTIGPSTLKVVLDTLAGPNGCNIYLPSFNNFISSIQQGSRDAAICRSYNKGDNTRALAIEYGLKPRRIQQIIALQKLHMAEGEVA